MPGIDIFLLLLYASIALSSLYAAWKSYASESVLFERSADGTTLESSKVVLWLQVTFLSLLGLVMIAFLWIFFVHRLV